MHGEDKKFGLRKLGLHLASDVNAADKGQGMADVAVSSL